MTENNNGEKWEKELAKIHYEPEHETGDIASTCWCSPKISIQDGKTYIDHIANRDIIKDFIRERFIYRPDLIGLVEGILPEKDEGADTKTNTYKNGFANGWNLALEHTRSALKNTLSNKE